MIVSTRYIGSPSGKKLGLGTKRIGFVTKICVITISNMSHIATTAESTYTVTAGGSLTIPVTYIQGYDYTDLIVTGATVTANGIELADVNTDVTVEISDTLTPREVMVGYSAVSSDVLPSNSYYNYTLSEQIYTAQEINGSCTILDLSLYNEGTTKTRTISLYIKHTPRTNFGTTTSWEQVTPADLYFSGQVTFTGGEWTQMHLTTPFEYNGTDNLLIVCDDNTGDYSSGMRCSTYSLSANSSIEIHSDGTDYNPESPTQYSGTLLGQKNTLKLNIIGEADPQPIYPPVPTSNYFQYTNIGSTECKISIKSRTAGNAFINDQWSAGIPSGTSTAVAIPAGATLKLTGLTPYNAVASPLFCDAPGYTGRLSLDRFDESFTNYTYCFCITNWSGTAFSSLKRISSWDGAGGITTFADCFNSSGLESLPPSWAGLNSLTSLWGSFNACSSLAAIPASWVGLENVTSIGHAFQDCSALTTGGTADYSALQKVTNTECMFMGSSNWQGNAYDLYSYLSTKSPSVSGYRNTFYGCTSATGYSSVPSSWK